MKAEFDPLTESITIVCSYLEGQMLAYALETAAGDFDITSPDKMEGYLQITKDSIESNPECTTVYQGMLDDYCRLPQLPEKQLSSYL